MKHFSMMSVPAKAACEDHPGVEASIKGFLDDPVGVIEAHLSKDEQ